MLGKKKTHLGYAKMYGFKGNPNLIFKNRGVPTKSLISQLLLILDYKTWYQISEGNNLLPNGNNLLPNGPICKLSNLHIHEY